MIRMKLSLQLLLTIIFLFSAGILPVNGVTNLLINGTKDAVITVHDPFSVSFDFNPGDTEARALIWLDTNENGAVDTLTDIIVIDSKNDGSNIVDNDEDDEDLLTGSYYESITQFFPIGDVSYLFEIFDSGNSDFATLTVEHLTSTFTISGTVFMPSNQPFLYIEAWPADMDSSFTNSHINNITFRKTLPKINIFSNQQVQQDSMKYAALTDSSGFYTIYVPESNNVKSWNVNAKNLWGLAPDYFPPEHQMVTVSGAVTEVDFWFEQADVMVLGYITDNNGQLLRDEFNNVLGCTVEAWDEYGHWTAAYVESSFYQLHLKEGSFHMGIFDVLPFYIPPPIIEMNVVSGDVKDNVNFFLHPADNFITGRVTAFGTKSVQGVKVFGKSNIGMSFTETDTGGYYILPVSSAGKRWELSLDQDHIPPDMMVENGNRKMATPGDQNVDFNLVKLDPAPKIFTVHDIPKDQGLKVRVGWRGSPFDKKENDFNPITQYSVWRLAPHMMPAVNVSEIVFEEEKLNDIQSIEYILADINQISQDKNFQIEGDFFLWDFITTIPAVAFPDYAYVVPTLGDSSKNGIYWSHFIVIAHAFMENKFWTSKLDSGYSVDNMVPPSPKVVAKFNGGNIELKWNANPHSDVVAYHIFRSNVSGFQLTEQHQVGTTIGLSFIDLTIPANQKLYYRVAAIDDAFNEGISDEVEYIPTSVRTASGEIVPTFYKLEPNYPNPFNPGTIINYQIPEKGLVKIKIYNILGKTVKTLVNQSQNAGYYHAIWNGKDESDANMPSGVYFYQIEVNEFRDNNKMMLFR